MANDTDIKQADTAADEWLTDTAESGLFSELDQANIDALLSSDNLNGTVGGVKQAAAVAATTAAPVAEEMGGDLSQADLDALLGGGPSPATMSAAESAAEEMGGDLSQDDIDALLGGSPAPAAVTTAAPAAEEMGGDLSQADIDALLGGGPSPAAVTTAAPAAEEMGGDLHQADIDALLGGGPSLAAVSSAAAPAAAEELSGDLSQADIEALFGGSGAKEQAAPAQAEGIHEIDKSHLDALLSADTSSEISVGINALIGGGAVVGQVQAPAASGVPSQEEMDKIFFEAMSKEKEKEEKGGDDLFLDEMMGGVDAESASTGMNAFGLNEDDFKFDDEMPEIPADQAAVQKIEAKKKETPPDTETTTVKQVKPKKERKPFVAPVWLKKVRESRPIMAGTLLGLLLVLGTSLYYGLWHKQGQAPAPHLLVATQEKPPVAAIPLVPPAEQAHTMQAQQEAPKPQPAANRPPQVQGGVYQIAEKSLGVPMQMTGKDEEGDALTFQITGQPRFGVIYGEPPRITYVASIGFPGQDMFEFTANDGHSVSAPAVIRISGPDLTKIAAKQTPSASSSAQLAQGKPPRKDEVMASASRVVHSQPEESMQQPRTRRAKQPAVMAVRHVTQDILTEEAPSPSPPQQQLVGRKPRTGPVVATNDFVQALSTEPVIIDWAEIWRAATNSPFTSKVVVVIEKTDLHGQLEKLSASRHRYLPEPFFVGYESIDYRFIVGKKRSKARRLELSIANGNPYPRIFMKPLEKNLYMVGETVELDASATRDDSRETLKFAWEQLTGPAVRFKNINREGSVVRFQVPAVFASQQAAGLTLRMIARDDAGQAAIQEVKIGVKSRRQSPLWGDMPAVDTMRLPACPAGECAAPRLFLSAVK